MTIKAAEKDNASAAAVKTLKTALEHHGVEFLASNGVRERLDAYTVLEGDAAYGRFLDDVYATVRDHPGSEILITAAREPRPDTPRYAVLREHLQRLQAAGVSERVLLEEGDTVILGPRSWYRWVPSSFFHRVAFQIYGDKLALTAWEPTPRVIIIQDHSWSQTARSQFNFTWDRALTPTFDGQAKS